MSYRSHVEDKKRKAQRQQDVMRDQLRMAKQTGDKRLRKFANNKILELSYEIINYDRTLGYISDVNELKAEK